MSMIDKARNWVQQEIGVAVQSMKRLPGSTSSLLYEVKTKNSSVVLRQIDNKEWLREEPDLVQHEAASLQKAYAGNLSSPSLLGFDETGSASGFPSILMSKVQGEVVLESDDFHVWTDELAKTLAKIHQVEAGDFPWKYERYTNLKDVQFPEWTKSPDIWQVAFERLHRVQPEFHETFIHRDFHPANVLWKNKKVSGIIDWPNACCGPAGIDVGHCRVNLALLHSTEVADLFLKAYEEHGGISYTYDPYWDIVSVFDFLDGAPVVYPGWEAFGLTGLTDEMMKLRLDNYMESLLKKIKSTNK